ncbi:hypothetical protein HK096_010773 [Nowakowskiella sp. JEL0078]|nr:hypothetical protein HK096_010773 [Nowakowskiella sp. JEL0078]
MHDRRESVFNAYLNAVYLTSLLQGVCEEEKIFAYPVLKLYSIQPLYIEGKFIEEYNGDRDELSIKKYFLSKIPTTKAIPKPPVLEEFSQNSITGFTEEEELVKLKEIVKKATEPNSLVNPSGSIVTLNEGTFYVVFDEFHTLMFHSPTCIHCQRLSPVWEELGPILKNKVNVGKVDCSTEKKLAKYFGIRGYPTLKLIVSDKGFGIDYRGSRTLDALQNFALSITSMPPFTPISGKEVEAVMSSKEVAFFFFYDPLKADKLIVQTYIAIAHRVRSFASFYIIPSTSSIKSIVTDPALKSSKLLSESSILINSKDYGGDISIYGASHEPTSEDYIAKWISTHRLTLTPELNTENSEEILSGDRLVVLAIFDPTETETQANVLKVLKAVARMVKKNENNGVGSVVVSWLDGIKWGTYVKRVYNVKDIKEPAVLIIDPRTEEYYDHDKSGKKFIVDENQLVKNIDDVLEGKLSPKSTKGFLAQMGKNAAKRVIPIFKTIWAYPITSGILFFVASYAIYSFFNAGPSTANSGLRDPKAE